MAGEEGSGLTDGERRVFISYRRKDTSGYAGRLGDDLRDHFGDDHVFRDVDTIAPGVDFRTAIKDAVGACDALVVVIGQQWLTDTDKSGRRRLDDPADFVRLEIAAALERGILLLPVLVEGAVMPAPTDLPDDVSALAWHNAIEVSDTRWDYDVGRLVSRIEVAVPATAPVVAPPGSAPVAGAPPVPAPVAVVTPPPASSGRPFLRPRPWVVVALVAVGFVLSAFAVAGLFEGGSGDGAMVTPLGLAAVGDTVYVADSGNGRIVAITPDGVETVAGTGEATVTADGGGDGDGVPALDVLLQRPNALAADAAGNLYFSETYAGGIMRMSADGTIHDVPAFSPGVDRIRVQAIAVGHDGALLVATDREVLRVRKDGSLEPVAGTSAGKGFAGDGGPATSAKLNNPMGLAVDTENNIYIADTDNNRVRRVGAADGIIVTIAGTGSPSPSGDGGPAVEANLPSPRGIVVADGAIYVGGSHQVREIRPDRTIVTLAGSAENSPGFAGDGGLATAALLNEVFAVALDDEGNLYVADAANNCVRRISSDGVITTVAE